MSELPSLVKDLALILAVASIVTLLFKKLKQPLVLGYIVAGFLVSPHMPYTMSVMDKTDIQTWADIGVIFLLFAMGLDFSFKKILKLGTSPFIAVSTIFFSMLGLGYMAGRIFGWTHMECIFLASIFGVCSSTTIIYKTFTDLKLKQQKFTTLVLSVLVLEDVISIIIMVMLSATSTATTTRFVISPERLARMTAEPIAGVINICVSSCFSEARRRTSETVKLPISTVQVTPLTSFTIPCKIVTRLPPDEACLISVASSLY